MSMEDQSGAKQEKAPAVAELPKVLAEEFVSDTLGTDKPLVQKDENNRRWRCLEQEVEVPNAGKALLQVDYRQASYPEEKTPERFDQVRFDYVQKDVDADGKHAPIAEMHWYIEKGQSNNPYPFDLMQVHRYVEPEYRDRKGVGRSLYQQAESWAQQVADAKKEDLTLALSTDQPLTMKWATGLGYAPYPEEVERYEEAVAHPERFELVTETDSAGQLRNPALRRDGRGHRIWFRKILTPREEPPA